MKNEGEAECALSDASCCGELDSTTVVYHPSPALMRNYDYRAGARAVLARSKGAPGDAPLQCICELGLAGGKIVMVGQLLKRFQPRGRREKR
jgi:hypothetical protein